MSKVYKSQSVDEYNRQVMQIDYNERISERIEQFQQEIVKRRELRYRKMVEDFLQNLEYDEEGKPLFEMDEEGYAIIPMDDDGHPLIQVDDEGNILSDEMSKTDDVDDGEEFFEAAISPQEQAAQIIEDAQIQADSILADAQTKAQTIQEHARAEAEEAGYQDGLLRGAEEYNQKENALEEQKQSLQAQYEALQQSLERDLVNVICDVVEKVFHVKFDQEQDVIFHLVENTILKIDNSHVFIIKVSEHNAAFLKDQKAILQEKAGAEATIDIVIDPMMADDACMIETDGGVFDCGLDTQMKNLMNTLRALSV